MSLEEQAFQWAYSFCKYMDEKDFRKMCADGKSQTYNTAIEFFNRGLKEGSGG